MKPTLRALLAAALAAATLPATAAAADSLSFGEGGPTASFGANATVAIDGSITYDADCPAPGIDDFFYPATDVYVVPAGTGEIGLVDAGGGRPNTIVAGSSFFVDEVIAATAPAGQIDEGVYDVVYDTCQDGEFDPGRDTRFEGAITVALPDVLPLADGPIRELKDEARREYLGWTATRLAMSGLFKLADQALKTQCTAGNPVGCAMRDVGYFGSVKQRFGTLLLSQANHYLAIAEDPPDPDFESVTAVAPHELGFERTDSVLANATGALLGPVAAEASVAAAFLRSVERYQGAQAAGNGPWALVHARQARNLAAALRRLVAATDDSLEQLASTVDGDAAELEAALARGRDFARRVWHSGLEPDERRALLNQGRTRRQIVELELELRDAAYTDGSTTGVAHLRETLGEARAARTATAGALATAAAGWDEVVSALEAQGVAAAAPSIAAGGPYEAGEGAWLDLEGSAAGTIDSAAWDLDADGSFDDAAGLTPSVSFAQAGPHVIGLRATRNGRAAISYAVVRVADTERAPTLASPAPAERGATVLVGDELPFTVDASDPDGDPVAYAWTLDGAPVGETGPTLAFAPTAEQVGAHVVEVTVSDGTPGGGSTRRAWDVVVLAADADDDGWTATTDCDEDDPYVHPGANERLGNEVDDDCDAGTPDAPPGGLTGSMWSWGSNHVGNVGMGSYTPVTVSTPVPIPGYDDVVQVASAFRIGYGLLANGQVRGWGFGGELGNGTNEGGATPAPAVAVGGGPAPLSGVVQISGGSGHTLALRADGSVVAWGTNADRRLGDGSTVNHRFSPVQVLTGPDGPPLTGVAQVDAGGTESYALMEDGTVRAWGQARCSGGSSAWIEPFPVPLTLVGGEVRQIASGGQWMLFLKKDGTVLSCGTTPPTSGRPAGTPIHVPLPVTGLGPGSGVIDVDAGSEGAIVLKEDGTVWAWGTNANGSLAAAGLSPGASVGAPVPVPLPPGPPVIDVAMNYACHTLALRADGSLLVWGCDFYEQAGEGDASGGVVATPTVVTPPGRSVVGIANSGWNSLVLTRPVNDPEWPDRPATWVEASVADAAIPESGGRFSVALSAELPHDVTVEYTLVGGTAGGGDVTLGDGVATIPAGASSAEIDVPVLDDALDEDAETFTIVLRDVSNGIRLARSQAAATIEDDDATPTVSVEAATVVEGDTSLTDAVVSVTLSAPSGRPVAVSFATADGSAGSPADYQATSGRLVLEPGQQEATVHVAVRGDAAVEPSEALTVSLAEPENAALGAASATVTIADDEPLVLEVASPTVDETDEGEAGATFVVRLDAPVPSGTAVSVEVHVAGLSADVPGDVAPAAGTLVFAGGETEQEVTVQVQGDTSPEPDETFRLVLTGAVADDGRPVLPADGTIATILDDDSGEAPGDHAPPTTSASSDPPPGEAGWHRKTVTVTLTAVDEGGSGVAEIAYRLSGAQTGEATVAGAQASVRISAEGTTTLAFRARDGAGNREAEKTLVVRIDRTAPTLSCTAAPASLQPADHRLVPVEIALDLADGGSGPWDVALAAVESNEPDDAPGEGDGATVRDIQGFALRRDDRSGLLRAERADDGAGRVYTLTYTGRDRASNKASCTATVTVPLAGP